MLQNFSVGLISVNLPLTDAEISMHGPRKTEAATNVTELLSRIDKRKFTVGIMGLGYVGLPLAMLSVKCGFTVIGFDTDASRVALLTRGKSGIKHVSNESIKSGIDCGRFRAVQA